MSILGNNLLAQYYAQNQGLPFGYEAVEYLESDGLQHIDACVYINNQSDITIDCCLSAIGGSQSFGGVNPLMSFTTGGPQSSFGSNRFRYNNIQYDMSTGSAFVRSKKRFMGNVVYVDDVIMHTFAESSFSSAYTFILFGRRINSSGRIEEQSHMKLWSCKIDNIRNFIPCVRKSDDKPGLYDLCKSICPLTGTPFYINAGTGEFVTP